MDPRVNPSDPRNYHRDPRDYPRDLTDPRDYSRDLRDPRDYPRNQILGKILVQVQCDQLVPDVTCFVQL